ncbi:spore germination protein [Metabacillus sp. GX 13764]|uniref:GerAB/ArcD/ProY family transporter n=1 Tax=Metabacillus kandeliae TaxID=2900151 RepID=UPI001E2D0247|nr:GerAB/ArcD/ProY family transporter [Metabacillus kandeliae]MCD7035173.1 spore germination protein [Metabacillus kandeliae]
MQPLSPRMLFALITLFELGSAALLDPGKGAYEDAWLAIIIGYVSALPLLFLYGHLGKAFPESNMLDLLQLGFGKYAGKSLSVCYLAYFLYLSARVLRDFDELLTISAYSATSLLLISSCMMMAIMYFSLKGIESIASISPILFWIVIIPVVCITFLHFFSGNASFELIKPVLGHGIKPVLQTVFPQIITFPYGEMVVFTLFFPHLKKKDKLLKVILTSTLLVTVILSLLAAIHVMVLGPQSVWRSAFPMMNSVSSINISDFIQRLDIFIVVIMVIVGFAKIAVFFLAAVHGTLQLSKFDSPAPVTVLFGLVTMYISIAIAPNYFAHIKEGLIVLPLFIHLPFQAIIPALLFTVLFIRRKRNKVKI